MDQPLRGYEGGFQIWTPNVLPQASGSTYEIVGNEFSQVVEIDVAPGETVTAEPGSMLYMTPGVAMDADIGGLGQGCKRTCCAGESLFRLHLGNTTGAAQRVALTPSFPAKIVPLDLGRHSGLFFNRGAFLGAIGKNWKINLQRVQGGATCCFGGQGLFINSLHGDGMIFLNAGGTVMEKQLADGEEFVVDHHSVLAFEKTVKLGVRRAGGCMVCCCAQQGLFNATLTGPGFVIIHTMALAKLRRAVGGPPGQSNGGGGS
jgi:uncharacterized protein (AIM24 family)